MTARDKLIVALDVPTTDDANKLVVELRDFVGMFKVGSQLFTSSGPELTKTIVDSGAKVFLDLKFHDIPHQVAGAARVAAELGATLFTVHASGGTEMMRGAVNAVKEVAEHKGGPRSKVLAVSVLTSLDAEAIDELGIQGGPAVAVERLVRLAFAAGVDGIVCSPWEVENIRSMTRADFLIVTPGIRPETVHRKENRKDDQKRVATPEAALLAGADYLVVGRPITSASNPAAAARDIVAEIEAAETQRNK